jgi:hypothetical protein
MEGGMILMWLVVHTTLFRGTNELSVSQRN